MAASPDFYSLTPNEVEYLKDKLYSRLIPPNDITQSQDDEKVYFGRQEGSYVRLRAMPIKGASNLERRQSINLILSKMQRWRHLNAPNLIWISGFVTSSEEALLKVVSFCPSTTIMEYLETHPDHNKLTCCVNIATGLDYLHRRSIIHGAIRGSNVLVKEDGTCFLGEFASEEIPSKETLTRFANWTAPELMDVESFWKIRVDTYRDHDYNGEYKRESDIFAMGCTALEIYTGEPPAPLSIPYASVKSYVNLIGFRREPVPKEQEVIPPRVLEAILTMIDHVPMHRPHSGNALRWFTNPDRSKKTAAPPVFAKVTMRRLANSTNFP